MKRRRLIRLVIVLLLASVLSYIGDWSIFRLRGSPQSTVTIYHFQTVPLKGNKEEYDYLGSEDVPCSMSVFPQAGLNPCWYLRRNPNQKTTL
jgi:hypothetical protein